ncbi:Os02g0306125-like protein [Zea mays]|uniref:Os02g0306125-like protein n=3 Tax=Zea mays TaxID=4577 RepID=A0A1D6NAP0_MAIZE|nr:Os02g0306125-like protein [Zea mays]
MVERDRVSGELGKGFRNNPSPFTNGASNSERRLCLENSYSRSCSQGGDRCVNRCRYGCCFRSANIFIRRLGLHLNSQRTTDISFGSNLEVDYGSEENASIVYRTLAVDKELQPDKVKREMTLSGSKLAVHFAAVEARFLRASFSSFVDLMGLVTKLVEEYGVANAGHS